MIDFLQAAQNCGSRAGEAAEATVNNETVSMSMWELFNKGGWLMWPLLILGGVTVFIFVERYLAIRKASVLDMNFMNRIRDYILDGKIAAAVDLCRKTDTPIARMIEKGIGRIGRPMRRHTVGHRRMLPTSRCRSSRTAFRSWPPSPAVRP